MKNAQGIFYLIGTTILIIVINTIFFLFQSSKSEKNHDASIKTYETIETATEFMDNLEDSETNHRGYLLTKDTNYINQYLSAEKNVDESYIKLYSLLNDKSSQQRNLNRLNELINLKRAHINKSIKAVQNSYPTTKPADRDINLVKANESQIREVLKNITSTEKASLSEGNKVIETLTRRIQIFTVISNWILLVIVISALINIIQSREKIGKLFQEVENKNKQLEIQKVDLQNLSQDLIGQNSELERFAYVTSHDLRSPAVNLIALLQLHEEAKETSDRDNLIKMIREVADNLILKLDDLIDLLKNKHESFAIEEKLHFMHIFNVVEMNLTADIKKSGANLYYDFSEAPVINYPRSYLESIMQNLLSNALKYRHQDRVPEISIKTMQRDDKLYMEVKDNGLGIDLKKYGKNLFGIYKTFHEVKDSRGVGLYIIKSQIIAMGGSIQVESIPNVGSTFTVCFN